MDPVIPIVSIATRLNHCLIKDHTSLEKEQSLQRWVVVSGSRPQSLHIGSWGQFCLIKLLVVKIFLWSKVQAKNLHLGSAFAFEMDCSISLLIGYSMHFLLNIPHLPSTASGCCPACYPPTGSGWPPPTGLCILLTGLDVKSNHYPLVLFEPWGFSSLISYRVKVIKFLVLVHQPMTRSRIWLSFQLL